MNVSDLRRELETQAADAPEPGPIRAEADRRLAARSRRNRTHALIAAAAAVVLVAGGAGIAVTVLGHRSTSPAHPAPPQPVVSVPVIPLPNDSRLIRHQLPPVTSPVTATPPAGLTVQTWLASPGRLAVAWIDPDTGGGDGAGTVYSAGGGLSAAGEFAAGYLVTDAQTEPLVLQTGSGQVTPTVARTPIAAGGRAATLETAPTGTTDAFGYPAEQRITWQLPDGRWIHVWRATGPATAVGSVQEFAATVTDVPQALYRSVGIGVTLPGLTADSSANGTALAAPALWLCPPAVQPLDVGGRSGPNDPAASCAVAQVLPAPAPDQSDETSTFDVDGRAVHVRGSSAWTALPGSNLFATFAGPTADGLTLSPADLAVAAASIRLSSGTAVTSPDGRVSQVPSGIPSGTSGTVLSGAPASTAATNRPGAGTAAGGTTTLPPATGTVPATVTELRIPFGIAPDSGWTVSRWGASGASGAAGASGASGSAGASGAAVLLAASDPPGVEVRIDSRAAGLSGVPANARAITIGNHPAQQWVVAAATPAYWIGWVRGDGVGITVHSTDAESAQSVAAAVTDAATVLGAGELPTLTLPGLVPTMRSTESPTDPTQVEYTLCPDGTDLGDYSPCLTLTSLTMDTAAATAKLVAFRTSIVGGVPIFVTPDGGTFARLVPAGSGKSRVTYLTPGAQTSQASVADLAAILASIPG